MALGVEQIEALLEKNRALVARERERVNELKTQNADTLQEICSSLVVPMSAFGMSYVRAYFGERASIGGISIDAGVGLILKVVAACFGVSVNKGAQRVGQFFHDIANGALASWTAALGAEFGAKRRLEKPVSAPPPQPVMGAPETVNRAAQPMTHEDLATIKTTIALKSQPATPQPSSVAPAPLPLPPMAPQQTPNSIQNSQVAAATAPVLQSTMPPMSPSVAPKPFRFTQRWAVDPEAEMRTLLQSLGAPADSNTVNHLLSHENPGDEFRVIMRRARAPA